MGKKRDSHVQNNIDTPQKLPSIRLAVSFILVEIAIGLLGELMPPNLQSKIETLCGGYYTSIWIAVVGLTIAVFSALFLHYEGFYEKNATIISEKNQPIVINYRAIINSKLMLWRRILYALFPKIQPDADFIRAIGLFKDESEKLILDLSKFALLRFSSDADSDSDSDDLLSFLTKKLADTEGGHFLLLGESGSGKTIMLYKFFCTYAKQHKNHRILIREFRKDFTDVLDIRSEERAKTILLLDGLDESKEFIQDPHNAVEQLTQQFRDFKAVVISARLQLFKDHNDEPTQTMENIRYARLYLNYPMLPIF